MDTINKLTERFSQFPGIGPRQAKRFVYFLLTRNKNFSEELSQLLLEIKNDVSVCTSCFHFFNETTSSTKECAICSNQNRNTDTLMVVHRDADFENIERSGVYNGLYFIIGGTVPLLEKNPEQRVRSKELSTLVESRASQNKLKEVVFAFSVNPDGENTRIYTEGVLAPVIKKYSLKTSTLGRGLSTGTELEYPDIETIKSAFINRQ